MAMIQRAFGPIGRTVAAIGQGTWRMEEDVASRVTLAIRTGLDLGMTHVDTAELYGNGAVETLVGRAIQGRRDEVFLVSKVLPSNASRRGTIEACERSLRRLNTDRLDCYLLHWAGSHPISETVAAFETLKRDGKILSWGVSNFDEEELAELWATPDGRNVACNQVLYHLDERAIEHAVLPWCEERGVAVVAYSPFGHNQFPSEHTPAGRVLQAVAARHGATPRQIALAFLLRHESVLAVPKSSKVTHVRDNAAAAAIALTADDLADLDTAFPRGDKPASLPTI